jgi:hypothetical protein
VSGGTPHRRESQNASTKRHRASQSASITATSVPARSQTSGLGIDPDIKERIAALERALRYNTPYLHYLRDRIGPTPYLDELRDSVKDLLMQLQRMDFSATGLEGGSPPNEVGPLPIS